jgi:DNA-binding LytR/AlgR family response regulator
MNATALIAEDEPLLAQALAAELARAWPGLRCWPPWATAPAPCARRWRCSPMCCSLTSACRARPGWRPPWSWPTNGPRPGQAFPALVFVTAYDQYAVQAFEAQAVDYVLKPVQAARLQKTVAKLQQALAQRTPAAPPAGPDFGGHAGPAAPPAGRGGPSVPPDRPPPPLKVIQASVGTAIRMVPVDEVLYFEAADKYVRVLTAGHEYLIRTPLKELLPQLDAQAFWQVHRGTVVRAAAIDSVTRDEAGKLHLALKGRRRKAAGEPAVRAPVPGDVAGFGARR